MATLAVSPITSGSGVIANLEALNLRNYEDWSFRVETYLLAKDLWDVVDPINEAPKQEDGQETEFKAWRKNNAMALYVIQASCGDSTYSFIKGNPSAKDAWRVLFEKLHKSHEGPNSTDVRSVLEAYPGPTSGDARAEDHSAMEEGHAGPSINDQKSTLKAAYADFVSYVLNDKWNAAMELHERYPDLMEEAIESDGTVLQCVITYIKWTPRKRVRVAKKLVEMMTVESFEAGILMDDFSAIYLVVKILPEAIDLAKCMYEKNKTIVTSAPPTSMPSFITPVLMAQSSESGGEMAKYLYSVTPDEKLKVPLAAQLITEGFRRQRFDIGWDLIQKYPNLAIAKDYDGKTPLNVLAGIRALFLSGSPLRIWERWVYEGIHIRPTRTIGGRSNQRHCPAVRIPYGAKNSFRELIVMNLVKPLASGLFHRIHKMRSNHVRTLEFLNIMCKVAADKDMAELEDLDAALFLATGRGHVEYIESIARLKQCVLLLNNKEGQSMFQFAIECRQEKVYDLIYCLAQEFGLKILVVDLVDDFGNNPLHMVGRFSPLAQINRIGGAALQIQRELQWFKEVASVVSPKAIDATNEDDMTPRELFTKSHKELVQVGEKSMKEIATSCTVVGALVVTMMFAAAFTVPDDKDEKLPTFLKEALIKVFLISDAMSLFSSTTSVFIFLGILTSRYIEDDFLKVLPTKMILGLLTLLIAIVTMMIAFSSALYILLHGNLNIIIPVILFSLAPITSFAWMQSSFLAEVLNFTYRGPGIFKKKVKAKWE